MVAFLLRSFDILRFVWCHPLNRGGRSAAIARFLRWQVVCRFFDARMLVPWIDEAKLVVGKGETGLTGNIYVGLMEFEEMAFLMHALRAEDVLIDVGANAGVYTILAAGVVGAGAISFEPIASTYDRLIDQIHLNRVASRVRAYNCGVGSEAGRLRFTANDDTVNRVITDGCYDGALEVDVVTLDTVVPRGGSYILKLDVEGFEYQVLQGARELLTDGSIYALIIELNGSGAIYGIADEAVHEFLMSLGFFPVAYDPMTRKVVPCSKLTTSSNGNAIYIRDDWDVSRRCAEAECRTVHTARPVRV